MKAVEKILYFLLKDDWEIDSELFCGKDCDDCEIKKNKPKDERLSAVCPKYKRVKELQTAVHFFNDLMDLVQAVFRVCDKDWVFTSTKRVKEEVGSIIYHLTHMMDDYKDRVKRQGSSYLLKLGGSRNN